MRELIEQLMDPLPAKRRDVRCASATSSGGL